MPPTETRASRRFVLAASGSLLASFAGCISGTAGGNEETTTQTTESDDDHSDDGHGHGEVGDPVDHATVEVNTTDGGREHFNPHVTWITEGGTVTWVLESGAHTATAYHPGNDQPQLVPDGTAAWDSGVLSAAGETYEHTFDTPGVYHYYCIPHESQGMIGTVIVGEPDPHESIALESIPAEKSAAVKEKLEELNEMVRTALGDDHGDGHEDDGHQDDDHEDDGHEESTSHDETETHNETGDHEETTTHDDTESHNETDDHHE